MLSVDKENETNIAKTKRISILEKRLSNLIKAYEAKLKSAGGEVVSSLTTENLDSRKGRGTGNIDLPRENFGFVDGVSQPLIRGLYRGNPDINVGPHLCEPGEFILGYPDNRKTETLLPTLPASQDPDNLLPVYVPEQGKGLLPDFAKSGVNSPRAFGRNGTYLVVRQLAQNVGKFDKYLDEAAKRVQGHKGIPDWYNLGQIKKFLSAKMMGRWQDGTSLIKYPFEPGTGWDGDPKTRTPDNDFLLGQEDPMGTSCPYGSHVRRTNPRDSFPPRDQNQLDIVNRHRILRRGRFYKTSKEDGLLFMCINADIERQFEFIQQTWCMDGQFMGLENEVDPIIGRGKKQGRITIPTPQGPIFLKDSPDAVTVRGGEYFFLPSKSAINFLIKSS